MTEVWPTLSVDVPHAQERWAASGAGELTGDEDGPPLIPAAPVAAVMDAAGDAVGLKGAASWMAVRGLRRRGSTSCNGTTRMFRCADGWVAVGLPRPTDVAAIPAWLDVPADNDPWTAVAAGLRPMPAATAIERARLLEIPAAAIGETERPSSPWVMTGARTASALGRPPRVLDLSALWAGPLCASLLGGQVVKLEDPRRPDGARATPDFFERLNGGKELVAASVAELPRWLETADVVVSSARPRAFDQLGVDITAVLAARPVVWVAITAHGWDGPGRDRVGFGDDAAVAGGVVAYVGERPVFVADAVADPLTGLLAAVAASACLARGGSWFVDAPLARAAAWTAGLGR